MSMPQPGEPAPEFEALDQGGMMHKKSDYKGKNVVLFFYPKDDTPGCTTEACKFRDSMQGLKAANTQVLGVSPDTVESHRDFALKFNLPFPLLADPERRITKDYGVEKGEKSAKRITFLIGPDGDIMKVYKKVDPERHSDEVLADIQQIEMA